MSLIRDGKREIPAEDIALIFREDGTLDLMVPLGSEDRLVSNQGMVAGALYTLMQDRDEKLAAVLRERLRVLGQLMQMMEEEEGGEGCQTN